jgi:nicotinamide mononucleotide transporter
MIIKWLSDNYIEILGLITGLLYLYFSIKQNILMWLFGLLSSTIYIYVYFISKFYADMGLQVYYVFISIYGWYYWLYGKRKHNEKDLPVSKISIKLALILFFVNLMLFLIISYILKNYTDSSLPYWDAFTTAASIVATWMLARKIIEHWLIWIVVDSVSFGLYLYKGLYPTVILFSVYTIMAIIGYREWKKEMLVSDKPFSIVN